MPLRHRRSLVARRILVIVSVLSAAIPALATGGVSVASEGVWLAGDLHVHTIWSKDVCETPQKKNTHDASAPDKACPDPTTWGHTPREQLDMAADRGLDFLALTDHNTAAHLGDKDVTEYAGPVIVVPGVELTLSGGEGHANLLGWRNGKPADPTPGDGYTAADMETIAAQVHAAGALFSINHPINPAWGLGFPDADAVEVWNYPWSSQFLPVIGSDAPRAVQWWEDNYLAHGRRPAAVGGSDNHWKSIDSIQGVGQPTTWVFARDRSLDAVLDAIRAGRTTVSAEPPANGGVRLYLDADAGSDGAYELMVGDTTDAGKHRVRARVTGAQGSILRLMGPAGVLAEAAIGDGDLTVVQDITLAAGGWVRAEVYVPDVSSQRGDACRAVPVLGGAVDQVNKMLTQVASQVIPGASEARPINTGPCTIVSMRALTSGIYAL